jgi:hypothetical protein
MPQKGQSRRFRPEQTFPRCPEPGFFDRSCDCPGKPRYPIFKKVAKDATAARPSDQVSERGDLVCGSGRWHSTLTYDTRVPMMTVASSARQVPLDLLPQCSHKASSWREMRGASEICSRTGSYPSSPAVTLLVSLRDLVSWKLFQHLSHVSKRWRLVLISDRAGTVTSSVFLICGRFNHRRLCFSLTLT